jgi:hypothetical protein
MPNLTMFDGPVANLPKGADAYAGYVNRSGIGITWPEVSALPATYHLSITTDGSSAMCADVEKGAMTSWKGYTVGYCSVANVNAYVKQFGRPTKLWTAHTGAGEHICGPTTCNYGGNLVTAADGTQWNSPGGYDQSTLLPNFFSFLAPPTPPWTPAPSTLKENNMLARNTAGSGYWGARPNGSTYAQLGATYLGPAPRFLAEWGIGTPSNPITGIADDGDGGFYLQADTGASPGNPNLYHIDKSAQYAE